MKNIRVVGHTPRADHYIYDIVIDFADAGERVAAKVYRSNKCGAQRARRRAATEVANLNRIYQVCSKKKLDGVPRPLSDFTELGAVVAEKLNGVPLQSIIMKAALLPGYAERGSLADAAAKTGHWLRSFHQATADMPEPFDTAKLVTEIEQLCESCRRHGLDDAAIAVTTNGARHILSHSRKVLACSSVLNEFTPLNVIVSESGVGIGDYARMSQRGLSFGDVANFLAAVEALEKYPFCNRRVTSEVQERFLEAYGLTAGNRALLQVLKMKALLGMFAQGRTVKESALRKKVMWATVMKRFIQQAARRSLAPAA